MNHFQQSLLIKATPETVYAALTTPEGIHGWWTKSSEVANKVGGTIRLRFGGTHKELRIERLEPNREVRWLCTSAHINVDRLARKDEWVGTEIAFQLMPEGSGHTRLNFEHIGLVPSFECYDLCDNGWRYFLGSLQQFAETGKGTPHEGGDNCEEKTGESNL